MAPSLLHSFFLLLSRFGSVFQGLAVTLILAWLAAATSLIEWPWPVGIFEPLIALVMFLSPMFARQLVSPADALTDHKRRRLLNKVRRFWVDDWLGSSLFMGALIEVCVEYATRAVVQPMEQRFRPPVLVPAPAVNVSQIAQIYDYFFGEFLILGPPGSGKTIALLQLARELLDRADQDSTRPVPVVLNLSSWTLRRGKLADWLIDELNETYGVSRDDGKSLVGRGQIIPLLDGLDEVAAQHRATCVTRINEFRQGHGPMGLVVCSRGTEYVALPQRLRLSGAVIVEPLSMEISDTYLTRFGDQFAGLRNMIKQDTVLQELASSPLMLYLMMETFRGKTMDALTAGGIVQERRRHIFAAYLEDRLRRGRADAYYNQAQTVGWLRWLARGMVREGQTAFLIERLQPDWISSHVGCRHYVLLDRLGSATVVGLGFGLVGWLGGLSTSLALLLALLGFAIAGLFGNEDETKDFNLPPPWSTSITVPFVGLLLTVSVGQLSQLFLDPIGGFALATAITVLGLLLTYRDHVRGGVLLFLLALGLLVISWPAFTFGDPASFTVSLLGWGFGVLISHRGRAWLASLPSMMQWLTDSPFLAFVITTTVGWLLFALGAAFGNALLGGLLVGILASLIFVLGRDYRGALLAGLVGGLGGGLFFVAASTFGAEVGVGVGVGLGIGVGERLSLRPSLRPRHIVLVETFHWSWSKGARSALSGMLAGFLLGTVIASVFGLGGGSIGGPLATITVLLTLGPAGEQLNGLELGLSGGLIGAVFGLFGGGLAGSLGGGEIEDRAHPNQGIKRSAASATKVGLAFGVVAGLISLLIVFLGRGQIVMPETWAGMAIGIGIVAGVIGALSYGGYACISHAALRLVLWQDDAMPRDYASFLTYASDLGLLRRVGGSYSFSHELLLNHFAEMDD